VVDNLLIGILGALVGVFFGHRLTISMYRDRSNALEKAFYNEFEIIRDDFKDWFPALVDEYDTPLRNQYFGITPLDLRLVESLVVELAGTEKIISPDLRMLLSRLERMIGNIRVNDSNRNIKIKKWFENSQNMEKIERHDIKKEIEYITAQLLIDASQGLYFLEKVVNERNKFSIGDSGSINLFLERSFEVCNLEFNSDKWNTVIKRLGFN
jgi:hypothetical protein